MRGNVSRFALPTGSRHADQMKPIAPGTQIPLASHGRKMVVKQEAARAQILAEALGARGWAGRDVLRPGLEFGIPALAYEHTVVGFAGKTANSHANPAAKASLPVAPPRLAGSRTPVHGAPVKEPSASLVPWAHLRVSASQAQKYRLP